MQRNDDHRRLLINASRGKQGRAVGDAFSLFPCTCGMNKCFGEDLCKSYISHLNAQDQQL